MNNTTKKRGCFIAFEGIDGSGKSTQIQRLKNRIGQFGQPCHETLEPSAGPIGSLLRQYLSGRMKADEKTLAALFAADRLDHLQNETDGICPKLAQGIHVICDRYLLSSYAYQSVRAPLDWVIGMNSMAVETLKADCHIFIDVPPELSMERMQKGRFHQDLFETKERLTEVRNRYLELIEFLKEKETIFIIDGSESIDAIEAKIWQKVAPFFS